MYESKVLKTSFYMFGYIIEPWIKIWWTFFFFYGEIFENEYLKKAPDFSTLDF
jgi:hypothetical protein